MKDGRKLLIVSIVSISIVSISLFWFFQTKDSQQPSTVPTETSTYQNDSVPFTFEYPKSWSVEEGVDEESSKTYELITLHGKSAGSKVAEIRHYTFTARSLSDVQPMGTSCEEKTGNYEEECSYIINDQADQGYLYGQKGSNHWRGVFSTYATENGKEVKQKSTEVTLTLLDEGSDNEFIKIAESISISSN